MTLGFLFGSKNFCKLHCVSWEVFVLHGCDWIHWVVMSCTTTACRWLLRDSLHSLRSLWSAVIKSPKFCRSRHDCTSKSPARSTCCSCLQADVAIWVLRKVRIDTMLTPNLVPLLAATPQVIHEKDWKCLDIQAQGFPVAQKDYRSSTKFSLNSCSQSGKSCNRSLCTSSRSPFLFLFSVSMGLCIWFPRGSSLVLPLLSGTG